MAKEQTHFGYKTVDTDRKSTLVRGVFSSVANKYDLMNDLMSFGLHRWWKDKMVGMLTFEDGMKVLDVAGGTGDIAIRMRDQARKFQEKIEITVCDINKDMLEYGRNRAIDRGILSGIKWQEGDAENLPFPDKSFDIYTIAFGIRNVTNVRKALEEANRVLKPGGQFVCMEFSNVDNPLFKKIYDAYSFKAIPRIGKSITGDREAYQYLVESIRKFPNRARFKKMIEQAGMERVNFKVFNQGIVAIHTARAKP